MSQFSWLLADGGLRSEEEAREIELDIEGTSCGHRAASKSGSPQGQIPEGRILAVGAADVQSCSGPSHLLLPTLSVQSGPLTAPRWFPSPKEPPQRSPSLAHSQTVLHSLLSSSGSTCLGTLVSASSTRMRAHEGRDVGFLSPLTQPCPVA